MQNLLEAHNFLHNMHSTYPGYHLTWGNIAHQLRDTPQSETAQIADILGPQ